jgi:hypothetical protein
MKTLLTASLVVCGVMLGWVPMAPAQIRIGVGGFPGVGVRIGPGVGVSVGGFGISVGGGNGYYPYGYYNRYPYSYSSPYYGYSGGYYAGYGVAPVATAPNAAVGSYARATIVNPAKNAATLGFQVNGQPYTLAAGTQQDVITGPGVEILFDRGEQFGTARYSLNGGVYVFTPTPGGWELLQQTAEQVPSPAAGSILQPSVRSQGGVPNNL